MLVSLSACSPKPQTDCGYVQNVYGERISWKGHTAIVMKLHESVPKEYEAAIIDAANSWNRSAGKTVISIDLASRVTGPIEARKDTENVIYFYPTWEADKPMEQARTSIYWRGDLIEEADMRINAMNFTYYVKDNNRSVPAGAINIEALVVHEMGHVLGLKHNDASASVMATYLQSGVDRVQLTENDITSLKCEY